MSSPSNLYAEKIFSEHPLALWALDDKADFISLFSQSDKNFTISPSAWSIAGGTLSTIIPTSLTIPIDDARTVKLSNSEGSDQIVLTSREIINFQDLNPDKNTFTVGLHFNSSTENIDNVRIGYSYDEEDPVFETFTIPVDNEWLFLSKAFNVPNVNAMMQVVIEINFTESEATLDYYINGISLGQWSEDFNVYSTGVIPELLSSEISIPTGYGVKTSAYGLKESNGYYLVNNNSLCATNAGIPMVYGASNITRIKSNDNLPSLIVPGFGFMNESGKFKDFTFEAWFKINTATTSAKRIFGPIGKVYTDVSDTIGEDSLDGLYVDGPFLTLRINNNIASHFVGEWNRPMLIQIRLINNGASVLLNGEQIISMVLSTENLVYADTKNRVTNKDQDWLGFYAYDDIPLIELDSVAIYSYQVPEVVAKRRFVYGQGVDVPENIGSDSATTAAFVDYKVANYSNNYIYPDIGRWEQGVVENASTQNNQLAAPEYGLPEVFLTNGMSQEDWLEECRLLNNQLEEPASFFDLGVSNGGYFLFNTLSLLRQPLKGFYGVFKSTSESNQVLFRIEDEATKNYFTITAEDNKIRYILSYGGLGPQILHEAEEFIPGLIFNVGLDIAKFSAVHGKNVSTFFGNRNRLKVYVGGHPEAVNTFTGKIYRVGFATQRNLNKISNVFNEDGTMINATSVFFSYFQENGNQIPVTTDGGYYQSGQWTTQTAVMDGGYPNSFTLPALENHIASYTLIPRFYLGALKIDIATDSYWQDYIPLKYFGKFVKNYDNKLTYDLDFIQFNIGYPALPVYDEDYYDTSNSLVRTYITFQYLATGANYADSTFQYTERAPISGIIEPKPVIAGSGIPNWQNTRYEVVDDTIIYLPPNVSFEQLAIVVHVQIENTGIQTNPVKLRTLQLAGEAFDSLSPTIINTRLGVPLIPFKKRGIYNDYKSNNPFTIYKNSTPYLYMTQNSGVRLRGLASTMDGSRGISMKINPRFAPSYKVGAIQFAARSNDELFPTTPQEILAIDSKDPITERSLPLRLYVIASNSERTRGRIYAINITSGLPHPGLNFYLNGNLVKDLYISSNEWNFIGIQFANALDYSSYSGGIAVTGPLVVNNISSYQLSGIQDATTFAYRTWAQVPFMLDKEDDSGTLEVDESITRFEDFLPPNPTIYWENILFIPITRSYKLNPENIYKGYLGINKTIVQDGQGLVFKDYAYRVYKDVAWQSRILTAV